MPKAKANPDTSPIVAIHCSGGSASPIGGRSLSADKVAIQRFAKDMIAVGEYVHPVHGWRLNVTTERMDKWVAAFSAMKDNGVDVEVVVDHRMDAEAVRGYLVDVWREGDRLMGVHEMRGDDGIALAQTVKNVSVLIDKDAKDGKGKSYGEAITHSAIVQAPVVPGQSAFVPIAASRDGGNDAAPLYLLNSKGNPMDWKTVCEALGLEADAVNDDNAADKIKEYTASRTADIETRDTEIAGLKAKVVTLEAVGEKKVAASTVDPDVLQDRAELASERFDRLVADGKLTKAVADKLKASLIGTSETQNAFCLSRRLSGTPVAIARAVADALSENVPAPPTDPKTGRQMSAMSDEDDTKNKDAARKAMSKAATGAAGVKLAPA